MPDARAGVSDTTATTGHSVEDEAGDIAALIRAIGEPMFLVGHSYGAVCSLVAARQVPSHIRKLVPYEPPRPTPLSREALRRLEELAAADAWDEFAVTFFGDMLHVPVDELAVLRASALWPPIVADAKASMNDLRALMRHRLDPDAYRALRVPVLLQIGSESPRHLYATDPLAAALPGVRIGVLSGQAHEGMTTAPDMYAEEVSGFLLVDSVNDLPTHTAFA